LLDYLNTYGVRLLTPIDWRWFYGDSVFIIDLWLWLIFGIGIWLSRRRAATRPARWALTLGAGYIAAMLVSTHTARDMVADAWRARAGTEPRALMVGPRAITPFTRDVIVDAGDRYEGGYFDWRTRQVQWEPMAIPKNDHLAEVAPARANPAVQSFLVWSRFPFWEVDAVAGGTRVTVRDARFVALGRGFAASMVIPAPAPAG
jgi:inner membrane protein